jgi:hypothetical protein
MLLSCVAARWEVASPHEPGPARLLCRPRSVRSSRPRQLLFRWSRDETGGADTAWCVRHLCPDECSALPHLPCAVRHSCSVDGVHLSTIRDLRPSKLRNTGLINPILISAPPILVFLLILLVPSVLAQPRVRSPEEIAAEAAQEEAAIAASARLREAKARANAQVRTAQIQGLASNVSAVTGRTVGALPEPVTQSEPARTPRTKIEPIEPGDSGVFTVPSQQVSRAMWNTLSLKDRVTKSGIISMQEIAETLAISLTHARNLAREVKGEAPSVPGRSGVPYQALIDALYERRTKDSFAQAQKLEGALGLRKKMRQLHVIEQTDETLEEAPGDEEQAL